MEEVKVSDRKAHLINELLQGMEFAKQLRNQILNPTKSNSSLSSSDDNNNDQVALNNSLLLEKMLSSFDKTITIAKLLHSQLPQDHNPFSDSPRSFTNSSPKSENSHPEFPPLKKRRSMMPKWTTSVQLSREGAFEDGYSWRKYGQKEILGAKFPRGYYRCTHRYSKGCAAKKQVQRSDEDPSNYKIMYRGEHTCAPGAHLNQAQLFSKSPTQMKSEQQPLPSPQQHEVNVGLSPEGDLKVEPEQEEPQNYAQIFRSFSFNSTHLQTDPMEYYMLNLCPGFGSPTTTESIYLPVSSYRATEVPTGIIVQTSDTDDNEPISGPNSVQNSPMMGDFEFPLDELLDFGGNFSFEP